MSKIIFLLSLLTLFACKIESSKQPENSTGETKQFFPVTNIEDNDRVQRVCAALRNKESVMNVLISSGNEYKFSYAQKGCGDSALPAAKDVTATIIQSDSRFLFKTKNGEQFGFTDVETAVQGVMKSICNFGGTLQSPIESSPGNGLWWSTFVSTEHCQAGFGNLCVHLQRGSSRDGVNYKIHTNEFIKFKVLEDEEGFFIERKLISSAGCKDGKTVMMQAIMK